jgi:hypothetical protein
MPHQNQKSTSLMDNAGIVCLMSMSPLIFSKIQDEKNKMLENKF